MKNDNQISDEQINALIDNQLTADEQARILRLAQSDTVLARRIDSRRRIKEMLSFAYAQQTASSDLNLPRRRVSNWYSIAASVMVFVVGGMMGAVGHMQIAGTDVEQIIEKVALLDAAPDKMILQIDSNDPERIREALRDAELILTQSDRANEAIELEVIANAAALVMLDVTSPYREQIARISASHGNVRFLACGNGLKKFRQKGINLKLIPQAEVVPGVTTQVAMRLNQGWSYLRE